MPRRPGIRDLKKRLRKRLNLWLIITLILLLTDEYVKEGYLFDYHDVIYPGTHEFLVVLVVALYLLLYFTVARKYGD